MSQNSISARDDAHITSPSDQQVRKTVVVVGAGLIGTLSTYWLSRSGKYNVICVEKGGMPACATSKANAGRFCPSLLADFAPKLQALQSLVRSGGEGSVGNVTWSPAVISWGLKYIQAATLRREQINNTLDQMGKLSLRLMMQLINSEIDIETVSPNVWVYDNAASLTLGETTLQKTAGSKYERIDAEKCSALTGIARSLFGTSGGCLSVISDFTADAKEFTTKVATRSCQLGAQFRYNTRIEGLIRNVSGDLVAVELHDGTKLECNSVVIAGGPWSDQINQKLFGVRLPILPVRGASVQLENVENIPSVGFADNSSGQVHFQATPFGNKTLRLAGFADVVSAPSEALVEAECPTRYREALLARLKVVLPEVKWSSESPLWCGLRPITPDRLPIIGPTNQQGVFLNVGHGAIGWTLAAASGYLLCASMLQADNFQSLGVDEDGDNFDITLVSFTRF